MMSQSISKFDTDVRSDPLFEKLFESSPDGIVVADAGGAVVRVNEQAERMFGYSRAELLGQAIDILAPERLRDPHSSFRQSCFACLQSPPMCVSFEACGRRRNGSEFPAEIMLSPILEAAGGPLVLAVIRDISSRKRTEEALRDREQQLQRIFDNSPGAIFVKDLEGRYLKVNHEIERFLGLSEEQIVGRTARDFFPKELAEELMARDRQVVETGTVLESEGVIPHPDGLHTYIVVRFPLLDASGAPYAVCGIYTDITERQRAEKALRESEERFRQIAGNIREVFWIVEIESGAILYASPAYEEIWGRSLHSLYEHGLDWIEGIHCHDRKSIQERYAEALRKKEGFEAEYRIVRPDGAIRFIHDRGFPVLDAAGRPYRLAGIATDITERQQAHRLAQERLYLQDELKTEYNFEEIIGESAALKRVLKQVETVAHTDATVLILGETGTGKELIARAIHNLSRRRERTFVKLNCAAVPSGLLESELFGHEKGAFTGAIARKIGRLEVANGGTLLLDEIGDIPLELQPKLLRALQEKEFERLGSTRTIPVDVRLVAATNRDLAQMVKDGRFRRDLFYRLHVFPITIPPLRERAEDIPRLVHYFLQKHAQRSDKPIKTIPPQAMQALERWHWPGNVRELENLIERAVILSTGTELRVPLSELQSDADAPSAHAGSPTLQSVEREHILEVLRETKGVIGGPRGAAIKLGLKRTTLHFKMRKLGIAREDIA